jgi:predicted DNA-binding transcriptional regulator AlpA
MGKQQTIPAYERAGLSRLEAAEFVGVSGTLFDEMVSDGRMPPPHQANTRTIWSRKELERYFDDLPYASPRNHNVDAEDQWTARA